MPTMSNTTFKTIAPITTWYNGAEVEASVFYLQCTGDNLSNQATFNYSLYTTTEPTTGEENGYLQFTVSQGYVTMTGDDYAAWATNDYAFEWAATQLHITITGDYTPPMPNPGPGPGPM